MLFTEIIAVYCENHTEHTNTLCGHNAEFLYCSSGWYVKLLDLKRSWYLITQHLWNDTEITFTTN
jgi:hypothetical protein